MGLADAAQAAALAIAVWLLRLLPPEAASNFGGFCARAVGPLLPVAGIADANLRLALPQLDAPARRAIIHNVFDNLGRTTAELPHLAGLKRTSSGPGWELEGEAHIQNLLAQASHAPGQALFFSGHFANWELILPIAASVGLNVAGFYRAASNPRVDRLIQSLREPALGTHASMFAKGAQGARAALAHLHSGGSLGLLVDQKMNDGISVPFFGHPAMTAPALAQFALRFNLPIIPIHLVRVAPARLRLIVDAPLQVPRTGNRTADTLAIMQAVNATLERWITADPGAWLWLHRRWPKGGMNSLAERK